LFDDEVIERACASLALSPAERGRVAEVVAAARTDLRPHAARLERHLVRCARLCRAHGAQLVVLTYPEAIGLDATTRRIAAAGHAELIDLAPRFRTALETRRVDELFVLDGHCNDAGYALIAEAVLEHVRAR
jgi:hypothetical protein